MLPYFLIMLAAFLADRLTKLWVADYLAQHGSVTVTNWLTFYLTYNRGVAFGMFQGIGQTVGWITVVVLIFMVRYMLHLPREMWLMRLGLALVVGGAAGNLIDRILVGEVLDFIAVSFIPWVINVADIAVNSGMAIALVGSFIQHPRKEDKLAGEEISQTGDAEAG